MSNQSATNRKNYTAREKEYFVDIFAKYSHQLIGKSKKEKQEAWDSIVHEYNLISETGSRTKDQLRDVYYALKKRTTDALSNDQIEEYDHMTIKVLGCMAARKRKRNSNSGDDTMNDESSTSYSYQAEDDEQSYAIDTTTDETDKETSGKQKEVMQNLKMEEKMLKLQLLQVKTERAKTKLAMLQMQREMMEIELAKKRKLNCYK